MAEFMTGMKRTDYCGDLRIGDVGREVTVCGWVQRCRDLGQLIFIDLRDRTVLFSLHSMTKQKKKFLIRHFHAEVNLLLPQRVLFAKEVQKTAKSPQAISRLL